VSGSGLSNDFVIVGLCEENLKPKADGPATLSGDLQGFWDMMMLQVDNLHDMNNEIQKIRENGWQVSSKYSYVCRIPKFPQPFFRNPSHQVFSLPKAAVSPNDPLRNLSQQKPSQMFQ
jgi:hypothetical protein